MPPRQDALPDPGWQWTAGLTVIAMLLAASVAYVSGNLALSFDGSASCAIGAMAPVTLSAPPGHAAPPEQPQATEARFELEAGASRRGVFDSLSNAQGAAVTPRRAIASLLPSDGDPHLASALTLAYSLRRSGNALPLVLFYIKDGGFSPAAREVAERAGWEMRAVRRVKPFNRKTWSKYTDAYTKLRLWDMADDFDQLLYLDLDTLAVGRIEVALDYFVGDGKRASQPLGVVRDQLPNTYTFNTGVLAVQPDHDFFDAMMAAGRNGSFLKSSPPGPEGAVNPSQFKLADQSFLNAFLNTRGDAAVDPAPQRYSWIELPPACNLMVAQLSNYYHWFNKQLPGALLLHYSGSRHHDFMRDLVQFDKGADKIVSTVVASREDVMGAFWADAWADASRLLDLPRPLPSETPAHAILDATFKEWSHEATRSVPPS